ncbi:MAG: hypothetical protein JNL39_22300, partial [Opitutaceae bacterium]|nr:hypothetical protein [Opitutaceae bacterium]
MRFFTLPALLAAALLSVVVTLPFMPFARKGGDGFFLEARVSSTVPGVLQAYFDDGGGAREALSARAQFEASARPVVVRLPLPIGTYRALRLDPLDRGGRVTLRNPRIVSSRERTVAELAPRAFQAAHQIESLRVIDDGLEIVVNPAHNDPQLL